MIKYIFNLENVSFKTVSSVWFCSRGRLVTLKVKRVTEENQEHRCVQTAEYICVSPFSKAVFNQCCQSFCLSATQSKFALIQKLFPAVNQTRAGSQVTYMSEGQLIVSTRLSFFAIKVLLLELNKKVLCQTCTGFIVQGYKQKRKQWVYLRQQI